MDLNDPIAVLLAAADLFERAGIRAAAYGGLTLAMYGEPRETRDADMAIAGLDVELARNALESSGLEILVPFSRVKFGGCEVSRFSIMSGSSFNTVDLVMPLSGRYGENMMGRILRGTLRDSEIDVVSPEDFVILKVLSTRDRDLEDARSVVASLRARLDFNLIRNEIEMLAGEIADHPVHDRFLAVS